MIVDLQRRLAEAGRIRIGQQVASGNGKSRPAKLDTFRLTSADRRKIVDAAKLYGGAPAEWQAPAGKQWELVTEVDQLTVVVPPTEMCFSQHYELWAAGGCQRRCDGITESLSDGDCLCNPDNRDCAIHTRLSVMLADLAGLGVWRIDTSGYYAAVELQGAVEVVRMAAGHGQMLPAVLRLEQRMVKRGGQTRRFAVPVLDIEVSPAQLLGAKRDPLDAGTIAIEPTPASPGGVSSLEAGSEVRSPRQGTTHLTPVPDSVPEHPAPSIAEQAVATRERPARKNAAQPIPATGIKPRTREQAASGVVPVETMMQPPFVRPHAGENEPPNELPDEPPDEPNPDQLGLPIEQPEPITGPQLEKLHTLLGKEGLGDRDAGLAWLTAAVGRDITSSKNLTKTEGIKVINLLEADEQ